MSTTLSSKFNGLSTDEGALQRPTRGQDSGESGNMFSDGFPRPDKYMPGLDVLRGIAIVAVLFFHGIANDIAKFHSRLSPLQYDALSFSNIGYLGVNLFFVLSGFLITGILLDTRANADYFKSFYLRRVVRIVPAYLLLIVVLKLSGHISWLFVLISLLYLVNMTRRMTGPLSYPAFWSLAVEEQFYLFWPFIIRKLRPRHSFALAIAIVALAPVLRFCLLHLPDGFNDIHYKTWAIADFFAGGAAIATLIRSARVRPLLPRITAILTAVASMLLLAQWLLPQPESPVGRDVAEAVFYCPWVILFSGLILAGFLWPSIASNPLGRVLTFFGYISYGLYLYHPLVETLIETRWTLMGDAGNRLFYGILFRFVVIMSTATGIAWISRRTFEQYFLNMKPRQRKAAADLSIET